MCATRSAVAIIKETAVGTPIPPEGAPTDSRLSADVFTVIPAGTAFTITLSGLTIEVAPGADTCPVMVATDASPATKKYEAVAAKNPDG